MLAYTGFPENYGMDEEERELTLGFWYLFQETFWSTDFYTSGEEEQTTLERNGLEQVAMAQAVYFEVVKVLRRKATFPIPGSGWSKGNTILDVRQSFANHMVDQVENFQVCVYRDQNGAATFIATGTGLTLVTRS